MASFDIGAPGPVGPVERKAVQPAHQAEAPQATSSLAAVTTTTTSSAAPQVQTSLSVNAGTIPVDQTRVGQIRKAVQSGNYPLIPAKIGDAMVAAGLLLRKTN